MLAHCLEDCCGHTLAGILLLQPHLDEPGCVLLAADAPVALRSP